MTSYIRHVTLHTAHSRDVPIDDLDRDAIAMCGEIISRIVDADRATHWPIPTVAGMSIAGHSSGRCISLGLMAEREDESGLSNIASFGIAAHQRCGAAVWRGMHESSALAITDPDRQPSTPWVATLIGPGWESIVAPNPILRMIVSALGSCLAAAWLGHLRDR